MALVKQMRPCMSELESTLKQFIAVTHQDGQRVGDYEDHSNKNYHLQWTFDVAWRVNTINEDAEDFLKTLVFWIFVQIMIIIMSFIFLPNFLVEVQCLAVGINLELQISDPQTSLVT